MNLLLDTHTYIWSLLDTDRLSLVARENVDDPANSLHLSIASLWEATIKIASGKMRVPGQSIDYFLHRAEQTGLSILPVLPSHLRQLQRLPALHRDPFDRILVSQSMVEQMPLISIDPALRQYNVNILW